MDHIEVAFHEARLRLPRHVIGSGSRRALMVAGAHGREHGSILVAYRLGEELNRLNLTGSIEILPVANPLAYAAGTRETPLDGMNLGEAFGYGEPRSLTQALAVAIGACEAPI